jgi:hypothetical protein
MDLKEILIFSLFFFASCNPVIEAEVEEVIEEGLQMRLNDLEKQKGVKLQKNF